MDEILKNLPYNSYIDLFYAIKNRKATIKIMRSDCTQIAQIKHPYFTNLGLFIGFILTIFFLIYFSLKLNNYWLLLWIPINFILTTLIVHIPIVKKISWILLLVDLFILKLPGYILISSMNIILISFFYNIWWNEVYKYAITELEYNEDAFIWSWNKYGLAIEDCYGNTYSKLNTNNTSQSEHYFDYSDLEIVLHDDTILTEIIYKIKTINPDLLLNKQNPYTGEIIQNYDDIIKYLKMYQLDCKGINPLQAFEEKQ